MSFTIWNSILDKNIQHQALIHLTSKVKEQTDSGNFACGTFADLQEAFEIVTDGILIQKLNH